MMGEPLLSFGFPSGWWLGLGLVLLAGLVIAVRRPAMPRLTMGLMIAGSLVLAISAGLPLWSFPSRQPVAVMVDLSPSTRTADYRDRTFLDRRIHELLRDLPYRIHWFSDHVTDTTPGGQRLADMPCDRTLYTPPAAPAVLLFSDCRFELPEQSPPTYVSLDAGLDDVEDASIGNLEARGNDVALTINNPGTTRRLSLLGVGGPIPTSAPAGSMVLTMPLLHGASRVQAELSPGDAWPENDALSMIPPPPDEFERWWVGGTAPDSTWRAVRPAQLPTDPAAYLAPGVIVLDDLAASELTDLQQQRLVQYLRDIGGGVVILGGNHAFAAGAYPGTALDSICPLASNPPEPTTHWVLLADSSGSMSVAAERGTRWGNVVDAVVKLLPHLPPHDLASVGSFAEHVDWWVEGKPVEQAKSLPLPPPSAYPHGPTNLQPALEGIARSADGKMPIQLLVLSDFETKIDDPSALAALLRSKNIHLHLLAIGDGSALAALRSVCSQTGGNVAAELHPAQWAAATRELAQSAVAKNVEDRSVPVRFQDEVAKLPPQTARRWNRTWLKPNAIGMAQAGQNPDVVPMAAQWNVGEGRTLAVAFDPSPDVAARLSDLVSRPPHDPRFRVTVQCSGELKVRVDAEDRGTFLDDQQLTLELSDPTSGRPADLTRAIPQTAPGRYELTLSAPRSPALATVRVQNRVLNRVAVAGRYAPEFDAIGNDRTAMNALAKQSGGRVVLPAQTAPLDIQWPRRQIPLASPLAISGAILVAMGLVWWRVKT